MQSSSRPLDSIEELKKLPVKELYRLIVDGRFHAQQKGFEGYAAREPNSVPAALFALQVALTDLDSHDISVPFINKLHESALSKVEDTNKLKPGAFRDIYSGFFLSKKSDSVTAQGLTEFYESVHSGSLGDAVLTVENENYLNNAKTKTIMNARLGELENTTEDPQQLWQKIESNQAVIYRAPAPEYLEKLMSQVCVHYNEQISKSTTEEEKLRIIAATVQQIDRIHPYADGNIRVSLILMQRMLLQNNFLPVMLHNPNCIDGYSVDELVKEIKTGMANTKQLIDRPNKKLFGYQTPRYQKQKADANTQSEANFFQTAIVNDVLRAQTDLHKSIQDISQGLKPKAATFKAKNYQLGRFFANVAVSPTERKIMLALQHEDKESLKNFNETSPEKFSHYLVPAILKLYEGSKKDYYSIDAAMLERHKSVKEKFISAVKMSLPYLDQSTRQKLLADVQEKENESKFLTASRDTGIKGFLGSFKPSQSWQELTTLLATPKLNLGK